MNFQIFNIEPVPKPRMTRSSKWKTVQREANYYAFKDEVRRMHVTLPESGYHVLFVLKMPLKWGKAKKDRIRHTACQKIPDKDNLEKALLDSLFKNDSHIWDGRVSKVWGDAGKMIIITGIKTGWIKTFLDEEL